MSSQQTISFQEALNIVESLPEYQQEDLIEIIRHRLIDRRQELLAKNIKEAREEYAQGVKIDGIFEDDKPPRLVYEPDHPDADENGFVAYPNINMITEMVNMMVATRAYEANVTAIDAAKSMMQQALEI